MSTDRHLTGRTIAVRDVSPDLVSELFAIMQQYFIVERNSFAEDFSRKDTAFLLEDREGKIRGFSSLSLISSEFEGKRIKALFSGDTIIEKEFWGSLELPKIWGRMMLDLIRASAPVPLYWFLISSGYKTYRFLPAFFREFHPRHDAPTPPAYQALIDHFGRLLFPDGYDPTTGVITLKHPTPLREGIAEVSEGRAKDPHVAFFCRMNPGHRKGDELACIAPLSADNLTPFIRRALRRAGS